ncbi:major facilitator superfamily multidrug- dha1 sub-family [Moniliophthora roreri MCA 2997]|uniref:Major facilitator superfamily multidrug-dha1 sub-family n=1 Tax=Moniliophthora roreri (strain MCA 2997) TaxID=1381753 RepID=V2WPA4_MONRO|nr:major facilitator superfamily multidrug- dha1 sub-family [Moniliophthora roreri MCA 2997]
MTATDVRPRTTPLPKLQIILVLLIISTEPITATVIYPFIPEFIRLTGITNGDEKRTGYYAGVIESMFFVTECLVVFHWGRASDKMGRRPILLLGPLGLAFAMLGFGLSKTFWQMLFFRCWQGMANGNIGVVKTLVAEITDDTNIADAYALITLTYGGGVTLGPVIGGIFSDPARRWPNIFGRSAFFHDFPYLLPCAVTAVLALLTFVFAYLGLKESMKPVLHISRPNSTSAEQQPLLRDSNTAEGYGTAENGDSTPKAPAPLTFREIITSSLHLQRALICHAFFSFTHMAYTVTIPLAYSTSISAGGLGLSPYQIGVILGIYGTCNAFLQLFIWKPMLKRIGARKMYILSYSFYLSNFSFMMAARIVTAWFGKVSWVTWSLIVMQMSSASLASTGYNACAILIVKAAPQGALGAVNGIQHTISSGLRGLAPLVASSLFAASLALDWRVSGGKGGIARYMVDLIMVSVVSAGVWRASKLPK